MYLTPFSITLFIVLPLWVGHQLVTDKHSGSLMLGKCIFWFNQFYLLYWGYFLDISECIFDPFNVETAIYYIHYYLTRVVGFEVIHSL